MPLRILVIFVSAVAAFAQERTPEFAPSYEVHILPAGAVQNSVSSHPDYWAARGFDLRTIIATVCDADPQRVEMPASLGDKTYDFVMVPPKAESQQTIHRLVREAIEKQFRLSIIQEVRPTDLYVLTAPNGLPAALKPLPELTGPHQSSSEINLTGNSVVAHGATLADLCRLLEQRLHRPVLDETGLAGSYNFEAHGSGDDPENLKRMLRDQLGLVLDAGRREVPIVVVRQNGAATLHVDHVTIAGADLATMREALTKATHIPTEYGGRHTNHATEMALASFPDGSYLELIALQPDADAAAVAAQPWTRFLGSNAGPCAFAVRVADLAAEVERIKSAGIPAGVAEHSGRARPDGTRLEWETAAIGPGARGTILPFLIHDLTPRENRAYPSGKATTDQFRGVSKVVIGVDDLDAAIALYRRAFDFGAPVRQRDAEFDAELAWFEGTPVVLARGLTAESWIARRVRDYGPAPCAFILAAERERTGISRSRWFGRTILWADPSRLGWRLGFELQ